MGYEDSKGRYVAVRDIDVVSGSQRPLGTPQASTMTVTANGTGVETGDKGTVRLTLNVTAASGTNPTLDVAIQTSSDNGVTDAWRAVASFAQKTGVAAERKCFTGLDRFVRAVYTIGGTTPSFTFTLSGETV